MIEITRKCMQGVVKCSLLQIFDFLRLYSTKKTSFLRSLDRQQKAYFKHALFLEVYVKEYKDEQARVR